MNVGLICFFYYPGLIRVSGCGIHQKASRSSGTQPSDGYAYDVYCIYIYTHIYIYIDMDVELPNLCEQYMPRIPTKARHILKADTLYIFVPFFLCRKHAAFVEAFSLILNCRACGFDAPVHCAVLDPRGCKRRGRDQAACSTVRNTQIEDL